VEGSLEPRSSRPTWRTWRETISKKDERNKERREERKKKRKEKEKTHYLKGGISTNLNFNKSRIPNIYQKDVF
jgi:hypothetical protein